MAKSPDERISQAHELYKKGVKLVDIAEQLSLPPGTVRRWKSTHNWDSERSDKNSERSERKKGKKEETLQEEVLQAEADEDLTDKQRLFCILYVKCFNATKAYQKAYSCSYETAMVNGSNLLRNTKIKERIISLKQNRLNREMLSEEDIFQKYMDIAFADMNDYVEFGREEVPVMGPFGPIMVKDEKTGEKHRIMQEVNVVKFKESSDVDGTIISEVKQGRNGASIKLADKMKALEWLTKHMDMATEEQKLKIQKMRLDIKQQSGESGQAEAIQDFIRATKPTKEDIEALFADEVEDGEAEE